MNPPIENAVRPAHQVVIGIGEMRVSNDPAAQLITYALGSCLGVVVHDPVARVGGILHAMLPDSALDCAKSKENPFLFVDSGLPLLFRAAYRVGAAKSRLVVKVAGGAELLEEDRFFGIGRRNHETLTTMLQRNGVRLVASAVGGRLARSVHLNVGNGELTITSPGRAPLVL